jgi:hypothetical protein
MGRRSAARRRRAGVAARDASGSARPIWLRPAALLFGFGLVALLLYWPVLGAPLFSDDHLYTVGNPWVAEPSAERFGELLDPTGGAAVLVRNYSPTTLGLHVATFSLFGVSAPGHHVVNVLLHALAAALLVALLVRAGVSEGASVFGGLVFLLHPANVEAVAWVSQLKTIASTVLACAALLLFDRRPALATSAFVAALLAKLSAAFALPVAAAWLWARSPSPAPRRWRWLAVWAVALVLASAAQRAAVSHLAVHFEPPADDFWVGLRTSVALFARYLVMGATARGLSAFHEPMPSTSWLDPWWLLGLAAAAALGARTLVALRRRSAEAGFWLWAAAAFAPVSQLLGFRFQFPLADRYLYPILPGLIGGALLAGAGIWARLPVPEPGRVRSATALGAVAVLGLAVGLGQRVLVWADPAGLVPEGAANYPQGVNAAIVAAHEAASHGDARRAVAELRRAYELGFRDVTLLLEHPGYAFLRQRDDFRGLVADVAGRWIEILGRYDDLSQVELMALGQSHEIRGEHEAARRAYQRGLAAGGAYDDWFRERLGTLAHPPS